MRVCGVELKGGEAIICLIDNPDDTFFVPDCRTSSIQITNSELAESIKNFHFKFQKLMEDYKVDEIVIIERHQKGKFAGTAIGFKLETAIQISPLPVALISNNTIKEQFKRNPPQADFSGLELKKFQESAFNAAYAYMQQSIYS